MRWKISHRGSRPTRIPVQIEHHHAHDPRQIDLVALFALLVLIVAALECYNGHPDTASTLAFIEPSQNVHW